MAAMVDSGTKTAPVKWAQRKDSLYVTISLSDVTDHSINLTDKVLTFSGKSDGKNYSVELTFFKDVQTEGSVWNVLPMSIQMKINKKEKDEEFWPRLLLDKQKEKTNVTVDWAKYVDEDEEKEGFNMDALDGGMDFGGMGGFPGMGGMGSMDFGGEDEDLADGSDSDDDKELPDLDSEEGAKLDEA